ncbi:MAG: carbon storage regulator [Planctomycetia bacterium]|nr:carbon storage regulator [Planctomycetia bacterium]
MLVLSRKIGQRIVIEPGIEIAIVDVRGGKVRIGVDAPQKIRIHRAEIAEFSRPDRTASATAATN